MSDRKIVIKFGGLALPFLAAAVSFFLGPWGVLGMSKSEKNIAVGLLGTTMLLLSIVVGYLLVRQWKADRERRNVDALAMRIGSDSSGRRN